MPKSFSPSDFQAVQLAVIAAGSAIGGVLRFAIASLMLRLSESSYWLGTVTVNLTGALAIGLIAGYWTHSAPPLMWRLFLVVGILGGFTTFSALTLDAMTLAGRQAYAAMAGYLALTFIGGMSLFALGFRLGKLWATD